MERLRAERAATHGGRRGAFYAPPPPAFRPKLGANHDETINDPPQGASGAILPMSLSGSSKNAKDAKWMRRVSIGWAETVGKRPTMEDAWAAYSQGKDSNSLDIFGVFDGHRGDTAAKYAAEHLPSTITSVMRISKNPSDWLRIGFMQTNMAMKQAGITTGTTVVVGMYWRNTVYLANAGDSRCVHGKVTPAGNIATRMTQDHKPERLDETERIIALGGEVQTNVNKEGKLVGRVNGRLGVSRALGDFDLQPYVIADPEITTIDLTRTPAPIAEAPENDGSSSPISAATAGSNNTGNTNINASSSNNASSAPTGASSSNSASPASNSAVNSSVSTGRSPTGNNTPTTSSSHPTPGLGGHSANLSPSTLTSPAPSSSGSAMTSSAPAASPMSAHSTPSSSHNTATSSSQDRLQRSSSHNNKMNKDATTSPGASPANSPFKKRPSSTNTRRHGKSEGSSEIDALDVSNFDFLVIACDGLWDVVADDEAVNIAAHVLQQGRQPEEAAKRLRNIAYGRGSSDNVTVLVIVLQPPSIGLKKSSSCIIL